MDVEPDTEETADIDDSSAEFDETETVREVMFDEDVSGSVEVEEYTDPPESIVEDISNEVGENADVVSAVDISPSDPETAQSSATIELEVQADDLDEPENAVILHRTDDGWTEVETEVGEISDGTVILAGEVDGFSLFAVAETSDDQAQQTPAEDGMEADSTPETSQSESGSQETDPTPTTTTSGQGDGFGSATVIVVLLIVVGSARYTYRKQ